MTQVQSKKQIAAAVFAMMTANDAGVKRKDVIAEMCDKAGLSPAGASTYHANFKSGLWKITPPNTEVVITPPVVEDGVVQVETVDVPVITEITEVTLPDNYTEMTKAQLVELFNSKSIKQVVNFRDHATAVRRVTELFTAK